MRRRARCCTPSRSPSDRETTFEGKVIAGFRAFLETLAATPGPAQVCIVEALAAGPDAIERRTEVMAAFSHLIEDNAPMVAGSHTLPALTAETIVGGVYETIFRRIAAGRVARAARAAARPDRVGAAAVRGTARRGVARAPPAGARSGPGANCDPRRSGLSTFSFAESVSGRSLGGREA